MTARKIFRFLSAGAGYFLLIITGIILFNSALDVYNNFAYEKAILKDSPYGLTPLLVNPKDYGSADGFVKCGDFVYVEDWVSAANGKIIFAKVRSRLREGYINKELLVSTHINLKPIIAVLLLCLMLVFITRKVFTKLSNHNIVFIEN